MAVKVVLDQDKCVSAGQCVFAASDVFDQRDEDGVGVVLIETPEAARLEDVRHAAELCPAMAIQLIELGDQ
jgi:ferredoxin